jgi:hypothetical protein
MIKTMCQGSINTYGGGTASVNEVRFGSAWVVLEKISGRTDSCIGPRASAADQSMDQGRQRLKRVETAMIIR